MPDTSLSFGPAVSSITLSKRDRLINEGNPKWRIGGKKASNKEMGL